MLKHHVKTSISYYWDNSLLQTYLIEKKNKEFTFRLFTNKIPNYFSRIWFSTQLVWSWERKFKVCLTWRFFSSTLSAELGIVWVVFFKKYSWCFWCWAFACWLFCVLGCSNNAATSHFPHILRTIEILVHAQRIIKPWTISLGECSYRHWCWNHSWNIAAI